MTAKERECLQRLVRDTGDAYMYLKAAAEGVKRIGLVGLSAELSYMAGRVHAVHRSYQQALSMRAGTAVEAAL